MLLRLSTLTNGYLMSAAYYVLTGKDRNECPGWLPGWICCGPWTKYNRVGLQKLKTLEMYFNCLPSYFGSGNCYLGLDWYCKRQYEKICSSSDFISTSYSVLVLFSKWSVHPFILMTSRSFQVLPLSRLCHVQPRRGGESGMYRHQPVAYNGQWNPKQRRAAISKWKTTKVSD